MPHASPARGRTVVLRDPRAIKALAHPARLAVIDEFFAGRRLTATECAEIAGLSASAMSYHLRALEKWGIIRRSEATGDGRERPWEAAGDRLHGRLGRTAGLGGRRGGADRPAAGPAAGRHAPSWISSQDETASAWYDAVSVSSGAYWLTQAEAAQLTDQISRAAGRLRRPESGADPTRRSRRVRVSFTWCRYPRAIAERPPEPAGELTEPGGDRSENAGAGRSVGFKGDRRTDRRRPDRPAAHRPADPVRARPR